MGDKSSGVSDRLRTIGLWIKVILLVVFITLIVVVALLNLDNKVTFKFIIGELVMPVVAIVGISFLAGIVVTGLTVLLRRSSGKR